MNALNVVPTQLFPTGTSRYIAYAGPSWTLSAKVGDATVVREAERLHVEAAGKSVVVSSTDTGVEISVGGGSPMHGSTSAVPNGFVARLDDGRSVQFSDEGKYVKLKLDGFGAKDKVGVFLKKA